MERSNFTTSYSTLSFNKTTEMTSFVWSSNKTSANTTMEVYQRPFNDSAIVISASLLFVFLVFGLIGNVLTIIVIATNSALKNVFMFFIISLCVSDLWSAIISWLCLYRRTWGFDEWSLPPVLCRFYWASDLATSYATTLHVLSFASLRFVAIQFPLSFAKIKIKHVKIWIILIWILTIVVGFVPFFIFFDAKKRNRFGTSPDARWPACTITMEWYESYLTYQTIAYPILFYAPTIAIVVVSVLIGITVITKASKMGTQKKRKQIQAVIQLVLIVVSFLIGYIPFTAYEFWSVQPRPNSLHFKKLDYWFGMIQYILLRFSETLNPVFYNLGSTKMRHYTVKFLRQKVFCCKPLTANSYSSQETNDLSSSRPRASCHNSQLRQPSCRDLPHHLPVKTNN